jgi:cytoskeletal protein CcmA (bactofilin family)
MSFMKRRIIFTASLMIMMFLGFILLFSPGFVEAAMISSGDQASVQVGEVIDDDLYIFGDLVNISGTVKGDLVVFASEVNIDGIVLGSALVFAETVKITGNIEGSVRGGANTVFFQGETSRDLIIAANTVSISGLVGNDLFLAASSATVKGPVGRDIRASLGSLVVDAPVGGNIDLRVSDLRFGPSALVEGKVTYNSDQDATVDNKAVISGALERIDLPSDKTVVSPARSFFAFIRPIISLLVVALLMVLLFPRLTEGSAKMINAQPGLSIGYGALIVFIVPIAALFLLITVIGIPISFLSILLYIVLLYLARIFAGYFLASLVLDKLGKVLHPVWTALIGVLVLALLIKIPYIGWLIHLAAILFAAGAFVLYLLDKNKVIESQKVEAPEI